MASLYHSLSLSLLHTHHTHTHTHTHILMLTFISMRPRILHTPTHTNSSQRDIGQNMSLQNKHKRTTILSFSSLFILIDHTASLSLSLSLHSFILSPDVPRMQQLFFTGWQQNASIEGISEGETVKMVASHTHTQAFFALVYLWWCHQRCQYSVVLLPLGGVVWVVRDGVVDCVRVCIRDICVCV